MFAAAVVDMSGVGLILWRGITGRVQVNDGLLVLNQLPRFGGWGQRSHQKPRNTRTIFCLRCGKEVPDQSPFCMAFGEPFTGLSRPLNRHSNLLA